MKKQKPRKRSKTLPRLLLIASSLLVACGTLPPKPNVELGVIDYPALQVITNITNSQAITTVKQVSYGAIKRAISTGPHSVRKPLSYYDRAICFLPREWEKVQNYLDALEKAAKN